MGGAVWKAEDAADDLAPQLATRPAPLHGQRLWSGVGVSTLQQPAQFEGDSFEDGADQVATSVLGCLSATLLTNTRTPFAMGRDGLFFRFTGKVHPTHGTPSGAIWFEGLWACFLILVIGDFDKVLVFVSVPLVIIGAMTVLSLFVFRVKRPDQPRPYKCWGYPVVPAIYVMLALGMLYAKILQRGIYGPIGIGVFIAGVPVYYLWKKLYRSAPTPA